MNFNKLIEIRKDILPKLEVLRTDKLIGGANEAAVKVLLKGTWQKHSHAFDPPTLRSICKVSDLFMEWEETGKDELEWVVQVWSLKDDPDYVQCPRCQFFHISLENYDGLCDRCCQVLMTIPDTMNIKDKLRENCRLQNLKKARAIRDSDLTSEPAWVTLMLCDEDHPGEAWENEGGATSKE